jgi:hypothetical protein
MPITASLGALSYPKLAVNIPFDGGIGFVSVLSDTVNGITVSTNEYSPSVGYVGGIGADADGNMFAAGSKPPVVGVNNQGYVFKVSNVDGSAVFADRFTTRGMGFGASCTSDGTAFYTVQETTGGAGSNQIFTVYLRRVVGDTVTGSLTLSNGTLSTGFLPYPGNMRYGMDDSVCTSSSIETNAGFSGVIAKSSGAYRSIGMATLGAQGRAIDCCTDSTGNAYLLGRDGTRTFIAKWNSSNVVQWKKQHTNLTFTSICASPTHLYIATTAGIIMKLDSTGTIVSQFDFNGGDYISIGEDGYLYSCGGGGSVIRMDLDLNVVWAWDGALGGGGNNAQTCVGIEQRSNKVFFANLGSYNGKQSITCVKLPSDGTFISPRVQWVGLTYFIQRVRVVTKTPSSIAAFTNSTVATSAGTGTMGASGGTYTDEGYVITNKAI